MELPVYCPPDISSAYLQLLRFARLSPGHEADMATDDPDTMLESLNALPDFNIYTRTFQPLLYHNAIKTGLFEDLDHPAQVFLKQNALRLVGAEMSNQAWLHEALGLFNDNGIRIILLKGAAFSNNLYQHRHPGLGLTWISWSGKAISTKPAACWPRR